MIPPEIISRVYSITQGSDAHQLATAICMSRGVDPYYVGLNPMGFQNWQMVVVERMMGSMLDSTLGIGR